MSKKLLFNFNREVIQNYTYVKYVGTIITATNTLEKPIKSATLKGSTKYRDIDTGEFLETFEEGRNLELVSVRMPVLTTSGVNVFFEDNTMEYGAWASNGIAVSTTSEIRCKNKHTPFPKGLKNGDKMYIVLSDTSINSDTNMHVYDENKSYLSLGNRGCTVSGFVNGVAVVSINDIAKCSFFSFRAKSSNINCEFALMINDCVPYEPFKTNILTVNEPIELRGIGNVKDELNCLTGELTQNIAEAVLSTFESYARSTSTGIYYMAKTKVANDISPSHTLIFGTNKFILKIYSERGENFEIRVSSKEDGTYPTRAELSEYLSQNPLTLCYIPTTSTVKTVDLSVLDQDGNKVSSISSYNDATHITTSSETISPIFEGYIATKEGE